MKRIPALGLAFVLILALPGCGNYTQNRQDTPLNSSETVDAGSEMPDVRFDNIDDFIDSTPKTSGFSYDTVLAAYQENEPGVRSSGFHNTSPVALETIRDVIDRAKNECTIPYDAVDISYDETASIWQVVFYTEAAAGGDQAVYMDNYGVTSLLIYGE